MPFFASPTVNNGTQVTVSSSAVQLVASGARRGVWLSNTHATDAVRVGPSGVTASTGLFRLTAGTSIFLPEDVLGTGTLYGIREGTNDVVVLVGTIT